MDKNKGQSSNNEQATAKGSKKQKKAKPQR